MPAGRAGVLLHVVDRAEEGSAASTSEAVEASLTYESID